MSEEVFGIRPLDTGRKINDHVADLKRAPAEAKAAPRESQPDPSAASQTRDGKNSWQNSSEVKHAIETMAGQDREISIAMDPESRQIIVKVINSLTGDVIRRMPLKDPQPAADSGDLTGLFLDARE